MGIFKKTNIKAGILVGAISTCIGIICVFPYIDSSVLFLSLIPLALVAWYIGFRPALILLAGFIIFLRLSISIHNLDLIILLDFSSMLAILLGFLVSYLADKTKKYINHLKSDNAELTRFSKKQHQLIKSSVDAILYINKQGIITNKWSDESSKFEWSNEDILHKSIYDYIHTEHHKALNLSLHDILNNGYSNNKHLKLRCKSGEYVWVSLQLNNLLNDPEIRSILVYCTLISHSELTADQLENNLFKYKAFFDSSSDCVTVLDTAGKIIDINKAGTELFEYSREEYAKMHVSEVVHPDDMERSKAYFEKLAKEGKYELYEGRIITKTGKIKWVQVNSTQFIQNGKSYGSLDIVRDITEKKEIEKNLVELNKTKDKFFSIISHDLRSPFTSIEGLSSLILERMVDKDSELEKFVSLIHDTAQSGDKLLINLLEWSKAQTGQLQFNPSNTNIQILIQQEVLFLEYLARNKAITLEVDIPSNFTISVDANMLKSIVRNLVANAIKFTQEKGTVKIGVQKINNECQFCISDNGIGMDQVEINQLFSIKTAKSRKGTNNEGGSGIGLLICKEFVDLHQGKIWAESTPNKGTSFYFTIPQK